MTIIAALKKRNPKHSLVIFLFTLLLVILMDETGGEYSLFYPLIYLPVVLAIVLGNIEYIIGLGIFLSLATLFILHPRDQIGNYTLNDISQCLSVLLISLIGGIYNLYFQRDRQRLQHTVQEQEALLNASQIINSCDKLKYAMNSVLLLLRTFVPDLQGVAVYLMEESRQCLELAVQSGIGDPDKMLRWIEIDSEKRKWTPPAGEPFYYSDCKSMDMGHPARIDPLAGSSVCVGINSLNASIGMIYVSVQHEKGFTKSQISLMQAFADRVGFPLQKIRLQERLEGMAYIDDMTGLENFRSFRLHLYDEIHRAERYKHPLSLVILDLDGFKGVNDRYGHPSGDRLLSEIGSIIRRSVRQIDIPVRYGGEEFAILCPETSLDDAVKVAERVRSSVENSRFRLIDDEICTISLSGGVSSYPECSNNADHLIQSADDALYEAKKKGKNQVSIAEMNRY